MVGPVFLSMLLYSLPRAINTDGGPQNYTLNVCRKLVRVFIWHVYYHDRRNTNRTAGRSTSMSKQAIIACQLALFTADGVAYPRWAMIGTWMMLKSKVYSYMLRFVEGSMMSCMSLLGTRRCCWGFFSAIFEYAWSEREKKVWLHWRDLQTGSVFDCLLLFNALYSLGWDDDPCVPPLFDPRSRGNGLGVSNFVWIRLWYFVLKIFFVWDSDRIT